MVGKRKDSGEIMLEGMIVVVMTTFILIWVLAVGFLYYQRYIVTAITNDTATKIANTYNNPDSDLIMGYITAEDLSERDLYRGFKSGSLHDVNEGKAKAYIEYVLNKTNFTGTIQNVEVTVALVPDSAVRKHIEVETVCTFNTPFGQVLRMFGMNESTKYGATARADCTDIMEYHSTVEFSSFLTSDQFIKSDVEDTISSVIGLINTLVETFNHFYEKK
ncbi:MAG: hypothetical protein IJ419_16750 [Agathobacter sp.]|nr:hypothetical protein [Agathobacter sp.]